MRLALPLLGAAVALAAFASAGTAGGRLPPGTLRGPEDRLEQYPTLSLATPAQRAAAERLRHAIRAAARGWRIRRDALAAGFGTHARSRRRPGDHSVLCFHAENYAYSNDTRYLDPRRPEALIYADVPGFPIALVGVMFSVPRGMHGPTPGGPITRWHTHRVCAHGRHRGLKPLSDGSCPRGTKARQGSEMMHFWLTADLRSAFAIHAPVPELCATGLVPGGHCRHAGHHGV
jgi:hypothetical protein